MKKMMTLASTTMVALAAFAVETRLNVIDVMVAYDQSAQRYLESQGKTVEAFAQDNIGRMNLCLANSGLTGDFSFRLAGVMVLAVDTSAQMLDQILVNVKSATTATGEWKTLWNRRDELGADLFSFVSGGDKGGQRGLGWTLGNIVSSPQYGGSESAGLAALADQDMLKVASDNYCFNVLSVEMLDDENDYTMAHEIGHNLGCGHPSDMSGWQGYYPYSHGGYFDAFTTVMGYEGGGRMVAPVFSSPNVTYGGYTTGSANSDNVRTLRNNYKFVAKYRVSKMSAGGGDQGDTPGGEHGENPPAIEGEEILGFTPVGVFEPAKALNGVAPYAGAVYDQDAGVQGVVQLKVGKAKKGTCKVAGTVITLDGKKYSIKSTTVSAGTLSKVDGIVVNKLGTLSLTLGANGFNGRLQTLDGATWLVKTEDIASGLNSSSEGFSLSTMDETIQNYPVLFDLLPEFEPLTVSGKKWVFAKAASVKYKKVDGKFELLVDDSKGRTNLSGLKLTFTPKTSTFKGNFTIYADAGTEAKPKLKKFKATVTGVVVGGEGTGVATLKNVGSWPVRVF